MAESVKVAVRVRPFNSREIARNATLVISMSGNTTRIKDPENAGAEPKSFSFDYSYWSHDEFRERDDGYLEPTGSKYADQQKVFDDLGKGVLENAWKGYNCSLFAYGQTGSGKSYSMVGYGNNKGIVPIFCDELFKGVEEKRNDAKAEEEYQVTLGMLEIYNEQVRDLLNPKTMNQKGGLKVRQHPTRGFYVESLTSAPVNSYKEIDGKINEGTRNRTVASTNMNATSSRAHTIVAITFTQKAPNETGQSMTRTSIVNLVDLAGSERADSTGATGDRLKEGSAINQSLSSLGNVIKALADQSTGKKKVIVPFRDSVLTKLLQNALGGNSKTIMIAALSPADINYEETVSTLRFADRAKAIKTTATVNESPTDRLIRELREENARLMQLLKEGGIDAVKAAMLTGGADVGSAGGQSDAEVEEMKKTLEEQLRQNQEEMENMKKSWEQRMIESQKENAGKMEEDLKKEENKKIIPHLWNLNEDPALTGMVIHFCKQGSSKIGSRKASPPADITLSGLSIQVQHAVVTNKNNNIMIKAFDGAKVLVNGQRIVKETQLHHNDRLLFGANNLFVFHHPQDEAKNVKEGKKTETPTFDTAQEEIAQKAGLMQTEGKSKEDLILQEEVVQILQVVNEANAMSEELGKKVKFEVALISAQARGLKEGKTEVMVKMKNVDNDNEWMWDKNKAINRKSLMQEIYGDFINGDEDWDVPQDRDPFWEPADAEILIGTCHLHLMSLAHKLDVEEQLSITNYKGDVKGNINLRVVPCDDKYNAIAEDDDDFIDDPDQLEGKNLFFIIHIDNLRGLPPNIAKSFCRYKFDIEKDYTKTAEVVGINPDMNFEKKYKQSPVTKRFIEYLTERPLVVEVWGRQRDGTQGKGAAKVPDTKVQLVKQKNEGDNKPETNKTSNNQKNGGNAVVIPPAKQDNKTSVELSNYKQRTAKAEGTVNNIQNFLNQKKKGGEQSISVAELEALLSGGNSSAAGNNNVGDSTSKACVVQ